MVTLREEVVCSRMLSYALSLGGRDIEVKCYFPRFGHNRRLRSGAVIRSFSGSVISA